MKILHINSYYSTSGLFEQLYQRQLNAHIDLDVYVPISHQYPEERLAAKGDYTHVARVFNDIDRYVFHIKHHKIWQDLAVFATNKAYDICHAHSLFSNGWLAHQLYKKYNLPYIVAVRNTDVRTFFAKTPWLKSMGIRILEDAQRIIFISQNSYDEVFHRYIPTHLAKNLKEKSHIIPNGIDDFWHDNRYDTKDTTLHQPLRIVTAGKVQKGKRFIQLAEMVHSYSNTIRPAQLHIIGPEWDKNIADQLQKIPNVYYYGALPKEQMTTLYREMDIFALLSYPETFGLVYPEAMSQGLPVIYTKHEGFDSFFDNHTVGVSVDKTDQLGFNKAVDYIIKHYDRLSHNALSGIEPFNWNKIVALYSTMYESILRTKKEQHHEKS